MSAWHVEVRSAQITPHADPDNLLLAPWHCIFCKRPAHEPRTVRVPSQPLLPELDLCTHAYAIVNI